MSAASNAPRPVPPRANHRAFALAFGLFLGLCIWKFGNPVILDRQIIPPDSVGDWLNQPWPIHWAGWVLAPLALLGLWFGISTPERWPQPVWLWVLPLAWLGWQGMAATTSVDASLTTATLPELAGCVACYFIGLRLFAVRRLWLWLLPGIFAALIFCFIRAVNQHLFEFPQTHAALVEGQQTGWTNFAPEDLAAMQRDNFLMITNQGVWVANPVILKKFSQGRAFGTLVYPNALAQIILLWLPLGLTLALVATRPLKPVIRQLALGMSLFLGGAAFLFTGSKLGWLLALAIAGLYLLRRPGSRRLKTLSVSAMLLLGLAVFVIRFHHYLAAGATSVSARFDYWHAAVQTTLTHPLTGSGPGTFQRPYALLKSPEAEMARLTHNDYLQQFSDSGLPGGLAYLAWIGLALTIAVRRHWHGDAREFALLVGCLAWFAQGLGEFGLYIPALAWSAFTLLGCLLGNITEVPSQTTKSGAQSTS